MPAAQSLAQGPSAFLAPAPKPAAIGRRQCAGSPAGAGRVSQPRRSVVANRRVEQRGFKTAPRARPGAVRCSARAQRRDGGGSCPVLRLSGDHPAQQPCDSESAGWSLLGTVFQAAALAVPVAITLALLPSSAPVWLRATAGLAAAALGAAAKAVLEGFARRRRFAGLALPPEVEEERHPLLGHTLVGGSESFLKGCHERYGEIFSIQFPLMSSDPVAVVYGAPEVRELLAAESELVESSWPAGIIELLGQTSLTGVRGQEHRKLRQVMNEVLNDKVVNTYGIPVIQALMQKYARQWSEAGPKGVPMGRSARNFTFDVSVTFILGVELDEAKAAGLRKDFDILLSGLFAPKWPAPVGKFHQAKQARKRMAATFAQVFQEFMPLYREGKAPKGALYVVVEEAEKAGVQADVDYVVDQMIMMLFAGTETTATSFISACLMLDGRHDIMDRLREELRPLQPSQVTNPQLAPYTRATANELLRIRPPVQRVFRKTLRAFDVHGVTVPANRIVMLSSGIESYHAVERDPKDFNPEQWLDIRTPPEGYMPFGHGARVCPGKTLALAEIHAMLAVMALNYDCSVVRTDEVAGPAGAVLDPTVSFKARGTSVQPHPEAALA
eukprot:jgi/Tetstr1/438210/TSEL_026809.t1